MLPSLYTFKGAEYDCEADADVRVKSDVQITSMMARKQGYYSEQTVYFQVIEDDHDVETSAEGSGAVGGSRRSRTCVEVEFAVDDLIDHSDSFPASAVSERVASVGERTVRRCLADTVKEGKLAPVPHDRSTTCHAGRSTDAPAQ